jgi:hypothetical protein
MIVKKFRNAVTGEDRWSLSERFYLVVEVGPKHRQANLQEGIKSSSFNAGAITNLSAVGPA